MKKWRLDFRIWHWVQAAVILGLLGTVFLRKTFLSWRANAEILTNKLGEINIEVTKEQAKALATAIADPLWEWHILLGYALTALILWRLALFFTKSGSMNYKHFKVKNLHKKMVVLGYVGIYVALFFMVISGLTLTFGETLGLTKELIHTIKEMHAFMYNIVLLFVVFHIAGVVTAELRDEPGIISNMIGGRSNS